MDCLEFLTRVLPDQTFGTYVGTYKKKRLWNEGFSTIEELAQASLKASAKGLTAYYALGVFTDNYGPNENGKDIWQRRGDQAVAFKTLALDIDCGEDKPYIDQNVGLQELVKFLKASRLPLPMIVSSGNGLHCYWTLNAAILKPQWVAAGLGLRALCKQYGFEVDWSKIHDASMVLRPIGTTNFKGGNTVALLRDAGPFDFDTLLTIIGTSERTVNAALPPAQPVPIARSALVDALLEGTTYPPSDPDKIVANCAHIKRLTSAGGAGIPEPEWYALMGVASACIDPEAVAINWSKGHETFTPEGTIAKLRQWTSKTTGPATCAKFDELKSGVCSKCQFNKLIASPAQLGAPAPEKIAAPAPDAEVDESQPSPFAEPSIEFLRAVDGIYAQVAGVSVQISNYDLFPIQIVRDPANGFDESVWVWDKPHAGYVKMRIRNSAMFATKPDELIKSLAENSFLLMDVKQTGNIGRYMRAYLQQLQKHQASSELYDSFGWKNDHKSFVIGNIEYRRNDKGGVDSIEVGMSKVISNKGFDKAFVPKGDAKLWKALTKGLSHPTLAGHAFALGGAFAAPLVQLTGLKGIMVSLLGETGLGKSAMLEWINSVYGNQHILGIGRGTQMGYADRMGMMAHMPITIDEVTDMPPEQASDLAYWATEGRDKNRKTEAIPRIWALPVYVSTNKPFREKSMHGSQSEAVSMRVLEFTFEENIMFNGPKNMGAKVREIIWNNYGYAGHEFIVGLLKMGAPEINRRIKATELYIAEHYGAIFGAIERYWKMAIVLHHLGITLANEMGLILFDADAATRWALDQLPIQRVHIASGALDTYDLIAEYQNEFNGACLTMSYGKGYPVTQDPAPRGEVRIRKEIYINTAGQPERGSMFFDKFHFQKWLIQTGYDMKRIVETVCRDGAEFRPNKWGKIYMGKDSNMKLGQVRVIGFDLTHEKLRGMLAPVSSTATTTDTRTNVLKLHK